MRLVIQIGPDNKPHVYRVNDGILDSERELVKQWDGTGPVEVDYDVINWRHRKIEPGDTFGLLGYDLLALDTLSEYGKLICMVESLEAHRLFMWQLLYWQNLRLFHCLRVRPLMQSLRDNGRPYFER